MNESVPYWKKVPEKGDENNIINHIEMIEKIEKKSPRKGTKTERGNAVHLEFATDWKKVPEKGDENQRHDSVQLFFEFRDIEKKSPRKGTKTCPT